MPTLTAKHALKPQVDRYGFSPACLLCHGKGSSDEISFISLSQENSEMYLYTHSEKLIRNKISGSVRQ
jgi:hypothetical protein